jgi:hypothetical protein
MPGNSHHSTRASAEIPRRQQAASCTKQLLESKLNKIAPVPDVAEKLLKTRRCRSDGGEIPISSPFNMKLGEEEEEEEDKKKARG